MRSNRPTAYVRLGNNMRCMVDCCFPIQYSQTTDNHGLVKESQKGAGSIRVKTGRAGPAAQETDPEVDITEQARF